jgi:hypothetical protein
MDIQFLFSSLLSPYSPITTIARTKEQQPICVNATKEIHQIQTIDFN